MNEKSVFAIKSERLKEKLLYYEGGVLKEARRYRWIF